MSSPTWNRADMLAYVGGDDILLQDILALALETIPIKFCELQSAIFEGDLAKIHQLSHTLKSSTLLVGGVRSSELCREIQDYSIMGDLNLCRSLFRQLSIELPRLLKLLRKEAGYSVV